MNFMPSSEKPPMPTPSGLAIVDLIGLGDIHMHIPQTTPATTVVPATGLSTALHEFVGVSWHVLAPYAVLGAGLMAYSQVRLVRGQRALNRQAAPRKRAKPKAQPAKT